jgi:hypothetical protein
MVSWKKWYYFYPAMINLSRDKALYFYAAALIALLLVVLPFYYQNYGVVTEDPISSKAKNELYGEYKKIKPLAEIVLIKEEPFFKRAEKWGILYYEFTSNLNGRQVYIYYNRQFIDNGWTFLWHESEYDKDIGYTGRGTACYQKGKFSAYLHYKEQSSPDKPTTFSLSLHSPNDQ